MQHPHPLAKIKMKKIRTAKAVKNILAASALLSCLLSMSAVLLADTPEDLTHPRYYTIIQEETVTGERIPLDNNETYATVDSRSIIRIIFDNERLLEAVRGLEQGKKQVSIRIEAYVKPQHAEKHPITVEKYSTVVRKTETVQEASLPDSRETKVTKFTTLAYEVYYDDKKLQLPDPQRGFITGTVINTHLEFTSLNLKEGDIVYVTISDIENERYLSKILEVKNFGLQVYLKSPIMLTFRQSGTGQTSLAPSPGTTIVFKLARRVETWFEDWLHAGVNVAFLNFDEGGESIEIGVAAALTIYKDFFEIGYGRNLTMRENPWYFYIGLNFVPLPTKRS